MFESIDVLPRRDIAGGEAEMGSAVSRKLLEEEGEYGEYGLEGRRRRYYMQGVSKRQSHRLLHSNVDVCGQAVSVAASESCGGRYWAWTCESIGL